MRELKRIIVGHDLRAGGDAALRSAMVLAGQCDDAALRLVHVIEPPELYRKISHPLATQRGLNSTAQKAGARLRDIGANEELAKLRVEYEVRMGKPFVELIVARRAWQADLIVVGGRPSSTLISWEARASRWCARLWRLSWSPEKP